MWSLRTPPPRAGSVASAQRGPMTCRPTGRPLGRTRPGTEVGGQPVRFAGRQRCTSRRRTGRPAALDRLRPQLSDRERGQLHRRGQQHVEVVEELGPDPGVRVASRAARRRTARPVMSAPGLDDLGRPGRHPVPPPRQQRALRRVPLGQRDRVPQRGRVRRCPGRPRSVSRPRPANDLHRVGERRPHVRVDRQEAEVGRVRDAQPAQAHRRAATAVRSPTGTGDGGVVGRRPAPAITDSMQRGVAYRRGQRAVDRQRLPALEAGLLRNQAERRLVADHAAERRRDADRAAAVGAQRQVRQPGRDRRARAAARPARAYGSGPAGCGSARTPGCR